MLQSNIIKLTFVEKVENNRGFPEIKNTILNIRYGTITDDPNKRWCHHFKSGIKRYITTKSDKTKRIPRTKINDEPVEFLESFEKISLESSILKLFMKLYSLIL